MLWVISRLRLRILWQSRHWMLLVQVGAVQQQIWVWLRIVFRKETFRQFQVVFCTLRLSLLDISPGVDPCCWLKFSGLLASTFQHHFFLCISSWIVSSNYLPINRSTRGIVSNWCPVKLRVTVAQDSYWVRKRLTYFFFKELDYHANIETTCTSGSCSGYWPTRQVL